MLFPLLTVSWIFAVYVAYYAVHKPATLGVVLAALDRLAELATLAGLLLLATALGLRLLRRLTFNSLIEELALAAGLGLGVLSLATLGLGLLGLLHRWLFLALGALGCVVLFPQVKSLVQRFSRRKRPAAPLLLDRLLAVYVCVVVCLSLLAALTPPIAWDSQVYHLTGPKLFIERGKITGGIDIPYLGFPSLVEMLFLAGMLLKGDIVAKLIHLSYSLLTIGLLYSFARRFLPAKTPWLAPAIYLSAPSLVVLSTWAYVDLGLAFYCLAAFYSLMIWAKSRAGTWLILSGIFSGMCLGVKYTALITPLSLCLIAVWESRKSGWASVIRNPLALGLTTLLVACPWYLKNLALTGNPFYPFVFGGAYWDVFRSWWYSRWGTGLLSQPVRLLIAPWEMTILGSEGKAGYEATIGPILLACLPLLVFALAQWHRQREGGSFIPYVLLVCGANYLLWLGGVAQSALLGQTRLLFPIFPLLAMLAAMAVEELSTLDMKGFSLRRFVLMALAVTLCLNVLSFIVAFVADNPLPYILGLETREEYLSAHLGDYYQAVTYVNRQLPPSARVLFLWEPRSYYCQKDCLPDAILDNFKHLTYKYGNAEGIAQYLHSQGMTHILLHKAGFDQIVAAHFDPILPSDLNILEALCEEHLTLLTQVSDSYLLYQVR
jgi:hypothetical protein